MLVTRISSFSKFIPCSLINQQIRTTYVVKRKFPTQLHKKGNHPKTLRSRHYVYEVERNTDLEKQDLLKVILTSNIDGLGNIGELVEVKRNYGYNHLLLPGLAVYASPENIENFKDKIVSNEADTPSSPIAPIVMGILSRMTLSVVMNKEVPWVLKPWHIKVSFRKCGYIVPENRIVLPDEPIKGPDLNIENKEFFVNVKISHKEQVNVRCRIHHWSTDLADRIPRVFEFWKIPADPVM